MDWLPPITTAAALGIVGWLLRNLIITRLTESVGFEFNRKLELLRNEHRTSEEKLRADLREKETEIATLRASAMTALSNRQIALDKRRLDAIDQLWTSVLSMNKARGISLMMSMLKFEAVAEKAKQDPRMREFLEGIGAGFNLSTDFSLKIEEASKVRPFVSPLAWGIFMAMTAIVANGVMKWHVANGGLGAKDFSDHGALANMVKAALPEYSTYVDQHVTLGLDLLVEKLDLKLLEEFRRMMSGAEADQKSVEQAAEIMKYSKALRKNSMVSDAQPFITADFVQRSAE
ncbi:MAG: hypothetical protein MRJ68_12620 [Nitrospira sp.]|nr:hypothetical protein [Nitrospira sp.]